ncbi:MAG: glycosyltransferase [Planctomycetota bacterium]
MTEVDSSHSAPPPAFVPEAGDTTEGPRVSGLESTLEENLCALLGESTREQLVQRILWAENGKHVIIGGPNPPLYRAQGKLREFVVDGDDLEESVRDVRDGETVFVFGISLGEQAAHILRTRPNCMVIAWERDPWLMRLALTRQDYWKSLSTGRLQLALGADLLDHVPHLHEYRLVLHPVLRGIYTDELRLVSESVSGETPSEGRRWIGVGMGGVVVTDLADALRSEGYTVFPLELQRWDPRETRLALERLRPEYVITVNYDADVATACHELDIPLVAWEIDPTTDRTPRPPSSEETFNIFTLRARNVEILREAGFAQVQYLPLGVDVEKRRPMELTREESGRYAAPVTFVGSSLIARAKRFKRLFLQLHASFDCCGDEHFDETSERLESVLAAERADHSVYRSDALLEETFGDFLAAAKRSGTPGDPKKWVAEIVASHKRIAYVTALADEGVHVWGDEGWTEVEASAPSLVYMGQASFQHELTLVYNGADINVDVNRIYQPDVVPIRVFDVLACGSFMIAEHSDALADLFEIGSELESYRTLAELEEKVAHYRRNPDEAAAIAARGHEAVRGRHTMRDRVKHLLAGSPSPV